MGYGINFTITWNKVRPSLTWVLAQFWDKCPVFSTPAAAHEPEEVQSKFFWGTCFGNVGSFCSAAYRLPEVYGCQGTALSWSLSILLRRVLPTNIIWQLICKRREGHPVFKPDFIRVQLGWLRTWCLKREEGLWLLEALMLCPMCCRFKYGQVLLEHVDTRAL